MKRKLIKLLLALFGFVAIFLIVRNYGFERLCLDFSKAGFSLVLLALTFIPTLVCYSIAWSLVTNISHPIQSGFFKRTFHFSKMMAISIAWNNLTPFLKLGGEPAKYLMLKKITDKESALKSTLVYNFLHLYATIWCFILVALLTPFLFNLPLGEKELFLVVGSIAVITIFILPFMLRPLKKLFKKKTKFIYMLRISYEYYKAHKVNVMAALFLEVIARFIEGITFYYAFYLIEKPIRFVSSLFLEVGRTFVDTIFFFVPYQLGSRETGIKLFMEKVLYVSSDGYVSTVFMYRFVEIAWIVIGYLLWISLKSASKDGALKSAGEVDK